MTTDDKACSSIDADKVKNWALNYDADLVGIASINSFEGTPPESNPRFIKPDTQSVVVLGFQVLRGALRGIETGTSWLTFDSGSPVRIRVDTTYRICREMEKAGWEATPIFQHSAELQHQGVSVAPDKPEPDVIVNLEYAAWAAGLGHMGDGKFFLTPEYGPRQVFTAILTDAALSPDPSFEGEVCDHCGECLSACPARAYNEDEWFHAQGMTNSLRWHPLHIESCRVCKTGVMANPYSLGTEPNRLGAACGRACVAHLEDTGSLKRGLKSPFRDIAGGKED